jgi:hypothetical protein
MQKTLDEICDRQRFTARQESTGRHERLMNKEVQFNNKISDWVRNCANYLMQGDFGIFCDRFAGTLIFFDGERESMYVKANHTTHDQDDSIYSGVADALHSGDKFTQKIWFKGKNNMLKEVQPDPEVKWIFNIDAPPGPGIGDAEIGPYQLDMRDGGHCKRGSRRRKRTYLKKRVCAFQTQCQGIRKRFIRFRSKNFIPTNGTMGKRGKQICATTIKINSIHQIIYWER